MDKETTDEMAKLEQINEILAQMDEVLEKLNKSNCSEYIKKIGDPEMAVAYLAMVEMMDENFDNITRKFATYREKCYDNLDPLTELM